MENEYKLDDEWINNFEKSDQLYKDFYTDDVYYTNLHLIYINKKAGNFLDNHSYVCFLVNYDLCKTEFDELQANKA